MKNVYIVELVRAELGYLKEIFSEQVVIFTKKDDAIEYCKKLIFKLNNNIVPRLKCSEIDYAKKEIDSELWHMSMSKTKHCILLELGYVPIEYSVIEIPFQKTYDKKTMAGKKVWCGVTSDKLKETAKLMYPYFYEE